MGVSESLLLSQREKFEENRSICIFLGGVSGNHAGQIGCEFFVPDSSVKEVMPRNASSRNNPVPSMPRMV